MIRALRRRLGAHDGQAGLTLVELLVAATMSVILVGAACAMLISAVRDQPALSQKSQNVTTARWQLERIVRAIRSGVKVETATPTQVSFRARVAAGTCGTPASAEAPECLITYTCSLGAGAGSSGACMRSEATTEGIAVGTPITALSGVDDAEVFCFVPSAESDATECGSPKTESPPTYVGVNLVVPNPSGPGLLTISDGATLRTAVMAG